jgi:hypothetical protein
MSSIQQWLHALLEGKRKGKGGGGDCDEEDEVDECRRGGAGWWGMDH